MAQAFNRSTQEAEVDRPVWEFKASLVHKVNSRTARASYRETLSPKAKTKKNLRLF